jgi:arylsulfatase A-like enzyme
VSLFTGVSPRDTGIVNNISALAPDAITLAEHFHDAGYETFAAVSITHLSFATSGPGQGFDRMNVAEQPLDSSETFALADRWLKASSQRPVFLWIHVFDAHAPYLPPEGYRRLYYPKDQDPFDKSLKRLGQRVTPSWLKGLRDLKYPQALYKSEITYLDEQMRGFYSGSRFEQGLTVMTADHGEALGGHNIWFEHKGLFPNTLSVPLIIKGPGVPPGVTSTSAVTLLDVGRTMLDLCDLESAVHPGRNLLELHETPSDQPRFSLAAHGAEASVTLGPWHLMLHIVPPSDSRYETHQVRLYHLERDPACLEDLVASESARSARLRTLLVDWLVSARPVGWNVLETEALDADELEALESLGYAAGERNTRSNEWFDAACECERCWPYH